MKFHLLAGAMLLFTGYLVYALVFGLHSDLETARNQIKKESVISLRTEKKVQQEDHYAPFINKTLVQHAKVIAQKAEARPSTSDERPTMQFAEATEVKAGEKDYWCRSVPVKLEKDPVKCLYPDACYGCDGPIIRPEYENAVPLCANGSQSQLFHVECCPSFNHGSVECPSDEACFQAENVPNDFCSCNDRPDCRLVSIGAQIQCVCIQN
ncbi:MAG: hypothetical protein JWQ35_2413 [Bacteriovoracaceae bacterium]|nr:hypothetical protein [Bacteriovoracaceae bacterium]